MTLKRIFRLPNVLLFGAGVLNVMLILAPLAVITNLTNNTYAILYGSHIELEHYDPASEVFRYASLGPLDHFPMLVYDLVLALIAGFFFFLTFFQRDAAKRQRQSFIAMGLVVFQMALGVWLSSSANHLTGDYLPGELDNSFHLEFFLHIFPFIFAWWAALRIRDERRAETLTA